MLSGGLYTVGQASEFEEPYSFVWDKEQSFIITHAFTDGPSLHPIMRAQCISQIIKRLHKIVSWKKVKKPTLQAQIWALYTKGKVAKFKINGFSLGKLNKDGSIIQSSCNFKAVTPLLDVSEDAILEATGLAKYF